MPTTDYFLFDDLPTDEAHDFNFDRIVDVFFRFLTSNHTTTPLSICIDGGWGTGKTSLIRTLQRKLEEGTSKISRAKSRALTHIPIWFEPWKLKDEEEVLDSLISFILRKIQDDANFLASAQIELDHKDVLRVLSQRFLKINPDEMSAYFQSSSRVKNSFTEIEHLFQKIAVSYLGSGETRKCFTIFVDDLDRCPPQRILSVLEAVKLFLSMPGFIFIFAMDQARIENAILDSYKGFDHADAKVYLEKIFQLIYSLPVKEEANLMSFVSHAMQDMGLEVQNQSLLKALIDITGKNIRNLKLFMNSFNFHRNLIGERGEELSDEILLKWLCLETILPKSMATTIEQRSVGLPIALEFLARGAVLDDPKLFDFYRRFLVEQRVQYVALAVWAALPQIAAFEELDDNRLKLDELHIVGALRRDKKVLQALRILNSGDLFFIDQDLSQLAFLTHRQKSIQEIDIEAKPEGDVELVGFETNLILPRDTWRSLGTKFSNRVDYRSAYFCNLLALIKDFHLPWHWGNVGAIYLQFGYRDVARAFYKKAYQVDPSNNAAYTRAAYLYLNYDKDAYRASLMFRKTLSVGETAQGISSDLGVSLKLLGDDRRAFLYALEAYQNQPDEPYRRFLARNFAVDIGKKDLEFRSWNDGLTKELEQGRVEGIFPYHLTDDDESELKLIFSGFPDLADIHEELRILPREL